MFRNKGKSIGAIKGNLIGNDFGGELVGVGTEEYYFFMWVLCCRQFDVEETNFVFLSELFSYKYYPFMG